MINNRSRQQENSPHQKLLLILRNWLLGFSIKGLSSLEKKLLLGQTVMFFGSGLSSTLLILFLVRIKSVDSAHAAIALSVAAIFSMVGGPVCGWLSDRFNPYSFYGALVSAMAILTVLLIVLPGTIGLLIVCLLNFLGVGSFVTLGALIGKEIDKDSRVRFRAVVKTWQNISQILGYAAGGLILTISAPVAFYSGFVTEALTLLGAAAFVFSAQKYSNSVEESVGPGVNNGGDATPEPEDSKLQSRDKDQKSSPLLNVPFVLFTFLIAVLVLHLSLIDIGLPLLVDSKQHIPLVLIALVTGVRSVGVIVLQISAAERVRSTKVAAGAMRFAGICFAGSALFFPAAMHIHSSIFVLILGAVLGLLLALGEVSYSVSIWEIVWNLAPKAQLGAYQGVFSFGTSASNVIGPVLVAFLVTHESVMLWAVFATLLVLAGAAITPVVVVWGRRSDTSPDQQKAE